MAKTAKPNKVALASVIRNMALALIPGISKDEAFALARRAVGK